MFLIDVLKTEMFETFSNAASQQLFINLNPNIPPPPFSQVSHLMLISDFSTP